ncbi:hypothetical protein [Emcibacter nanhaiensis]|uniref:hypothetical protein n=1 Tax=Emcibacter nanhaiensis TaxID=1505037 RepID=UPI0015E3717A|nr:hypothetical protein [Emcibacter nanhaiensis]
MNITGADKNKMHPDEPAIRGLKQENKPIRGHASLLAGREMTVDFLIYIVTE